jgi:hypothetical protein
MSENLTSTDLLIQYLDGELQGEQQDLIKKNIEVNNATREEFERLQLAKEAIKQYGLKNKIGAIHIDMMRELKTDITAKPGIVRQLIRYSIRIAASALIIVGLAISYQYFTASPDKLFSENFAAFDLHETRGAAASPLVDVYKKGNMQEVIANFNALQQPQPQDYFLAGNAFLSTSQPDKAIQEFMALQLKNTADKTHYFEEDVEYYLALSYLKNQEANKAIPIFEKIHADKNHAYHKKISAWFIAKLHRLSMQ